MTKKKTTTAAAETPQGVLKLLDTLLERYAEVLLKQIEDKPKLGDFVKMLETRMKLAPDDDSRKELWKLLEKVRREQMTESDGKKRRSTRKNKGAA